MTGDVRYASGGDNHVLRLVLYDANGYRCYVCLKPADYADAQIDHIIAKSTAPERLSELLAAQALPQDFDLDDPANLAPICPACNGSLRKGAAELPGPQLGLALARAARLRPGVIKRVQSFRESRDLAEALITIREANLQDTSVRALLAESAPGLVQALAQLGEAAVDYTTFESIDVMRAGEPITVVLALNQRGRQTAALLERLTGSLLEDLLSGSVVQLFEQILADVRTDIESVESPNGEATSGPPVPVGLQISLDSIEVVGALPRLEFTFGGEVDGALASSVARSSADGSDLDDELQADVYLNARFDFQVWLYADEPDLEISEPTFDTWDSDVDIT